MFLICLYKRVGASSDRVQPLWVSHNLLTTIHTTEEKHDRWQQVEQQLLLLLPLPLLLLFLVGVVTYSGALKRGTTKTYWCPNLGVEWQRTPWEGCGRHLTRLKWRKKMKDDLIMALLLVCRQFCQICILSTWISIVFRAIMCRQAIFLYWAILGTSEIMGKKTWGNQWQRIIVCFCFSFCFLPIAMFSFA